MSGVWVDTDLGFDDLWALLLLRHHGIRVAGLSLVAGNAPLPRVIANARGAARAYGFDAPIFSGADRPLVRAPESAARVLGPRGMQSRGRHLPEAPELAVGDDAVQHLARWLAAAPQGARCAVLALGPLTNIARLLVSAPEAATRITRLVWMGGSNGPGNHTPRAEFNALADPEAAAAVASAGLPLEVIDLMICRQVTFGAGDLPHCDPLTGDLLGGYLDIGLSRGRDGMAIYDPLAALALARPELFRFEPQAMSVCTDPGEDYGATHFTPAPMSRIRLATGVAPGLSRFCLDALALDNARDR